MVTSSVSGRMGSTSPSGSHKCLLLGDHHLQNLPVAQQQSLGLAKCGPHQPRPRAQNRVGLSLSVWSRQSSDQHHKKEQWSDSHTGTCYPQAHQAGLLCLEPERQPSEDTCHCREEKAGSVPVLPEGVVRAGTPTTGEKAHGPLAAASTC